MSRRTLLAGWFSFEGMGASAGDLMARDLAREWLTQAGHGVDVAVAPPFTDGIDWRTADPAQYSDIVFVCGPFGNGEPLTEFIDRFRDLPLTGLDLSLLQPLQEWNPFKFLIERDSDRTSNPDISFLSKQPHVPLVGTILIDDQPEYGANAGQAKAHAAIRRLLLSRHAVVIPIDTRLDINKTGLRTAAEVEMLIARMDVVITTRLHGTVLALKNGVPPIVIDSVLGGAKVARQAKCVGWPILFQVEDLTDSKLAEAFDYCLTPVARAAARDCGARAKERVDRIKDEFIAAMSRPK